VLLSTGPNYNPSLKSGVVLKTKVGSETSRSSSPEIEDEGIKVSRNVGYYAVKDIASYHSLLETYTKCLSHSRKHAADNQTTLTRALECLVYFV
jgi:hypothetical protein